MAGTTLATFHFGQQEEKMLWPSSRLKEFEMERCGAE